MTWLMLIAAALETYRSYRMQSPYKPCNRMCKSAVVHDFELAQLITTHHFIGCPNNRGEWK